MAAQRVGEGPKASKQTSRVRVAVRLRPYMEKQDDKGEGACVRGLDSQTLEIINWRNATETLQYQFDAFHDEQATQQEVFLSSVKPILPHILKGQNASVFAYGPTGAGKTHTMLGSPEQPGVIPRAVREVFNLVKAKGKEDQAWDYSISMSYLEIYNEKVLDLLCPSAQDLPIREDKDHNILIPGLTHTPLSSFSDFHAQFLPASLNRTTASTKLNQRSSRSHAILLIKAVRCQRAAQPRVQTGKLYLVDLAGSEDNRRTGNKGIRLKESGAINLSLFTLSKVVDALGTAGGAGGRVPYRDSKLTRLLQDSLGGSAHSVMITNIAPEYAYYFDTYTALNFAAKSKQVVNKPFVRETVTLSVPVKRSREEKEGVGSGEPLKKRLNSRKKTHPEEPTPPAAPHSPTDPSVLTRLMALEQLLMGTPLKERLKLHREIQELKEKQKEFESNAKSLKGNADDVADSRLAGDTPLFRLHLPPIHRKPSTAARSKRQQAVVSPLQVVQVCPVVKKPPAFLKEKIQAPSELPDGKENVTDGGWESHLDRLVLDKSKHKILQVLNSGSLKDLKGLQQIGDKKAKLILGWREIHGSFTQLEDLTQIEGITSKRLSSFIKANILSSMGT